MVGIEIAILVSILVDIGANMLAERKRIQSAAGPA